MLAEVLARYLELYPHEREPLSLLQKQIKTGEQLNDRRNFTGHITGSAIILSPNKEQILLIHHKAYGVWQQPGGHWEKDDADPLIAAKREGEEETGLGLNAYVPVDKKHLLVPFDIDSHLVPARPTKSEPDHYHHDFRYLFVADSVATKHQTNEVNAAQWFDRDAPEAERIQKIIQKLRGTSGSL